MKYVDEIYYATLGHTLTVHRAVTAKVYRFQTSDVIAYAESNGDSSVPIRPVEFELMTGDLAML